MMHDQDPDGGERRLGRLVGHSQELVEGASALTDRITGGAALRMAQSVSIHPVARVF